MIIEITLKQAFQISNQIRNNIEIAYQDNLIALDYQKKSSTYVITPDPKYGIWNQTLEDILKPIGFTPSPNHSFTLIYLPEGESEGDSDIKPYFVLDYYSTRHELYFNINCQ